MQRRKLNCFSLLSFASVGSHCNQDKQHFGISIGLLFYTADTQWWSSFCNQGQMWNGSWPHWETIWWLHCFPAQSNVLYFQGFCLRLKFASNCVVLLHGLIMQVLSFKLNVGHFPHLADLVTRINYNYFYMSDTGNLRTLPSSENVTSRLGKAFLGRTDWSVYYYYFLPLKILVHQAQLLEVNPYVLIRFIIR